MNNIYSTYEEYLENIDNDISEYLKKYDGTTEEDFYKELKERYELFDFKKFTVKIQALYPNSGLKRAEVSVTALSELIGHLFDYEDTHCCSNFNLLPDDFFKHAYLHEAYQDGFILVELGYDPIFDKKDLKTFELIFDVSSNFFKFNINKFKKLEQTYKLIFADRKTVTESETLNDIDDTIEIEPSDKIESISQGRFSVIDSKSGKQLLSDVTGKTDLNQKQVLVLGRLIKDKMFRFAPPTDTRLALGLDVLFNFSHKNIRGKLNLNKSAKELKINLSDKEKAELKLLLEKMINDLNVKY